MKTDFYTIEKLPNRISWSLNRKVGNTLTPVAYFRNEMDAERASRELREVGE